MTHLKKLIEEAYHYSLESVPEHYLFGGNASVTAIEAHLASAIGQLDLMVKDMEGRTRLEQQANREALQTS